jgi:site-specific DNA-methyltransferase (adenine-specific)/modification methylase
VSRVEHIGRATLYLGDCRDLIGSVEADCAITDPPYGVGLGVAGDNQGRGSYASFEDTPENVAAICVPAIRSCIERFPRTVLTPGVRNVFLYPKPTHMGSFYYPAASGCNPWGFSCWQPILYYGKDPYGGTGSKPDSYYSTEQAEKNGHPCPKPIRQMKWLVGRASLDTETVFDPFMGSGTTGVAAVQLGRKFIGCEIEPAYFDIACKRIEDAQRQGDFFVDAAA